MASLTNITKSGFTQTKDIYFGSNPIKEVYKNGFLIWEKSQPVTESWYNYTDGYMLMVEYTPVSNMTVDSFSMILDNNSAVHNYIVGIYTATGSNVTSQTGTSNVSIVAGDTLEGSVKYTHTMNYGGTGPSLTGGTSYYFCIGDRYAAYQALSSTADDSGQAGQAFGWSLVNTNTSPSPIQEISGVQLYLDVVAL